jgi:Secretion system C-terminal sorting domain/Beta-propeller repeat
MKNTLMVHSNNTQKRNNEFEKTMIKHFYTIQLTLTLLCMCILQPLKAMESVSEYVTIKRSFVENKGQITDGQGTVLKEVLYSAQIENGIVHILRDRLRFVLKHLNSADTTIETEIVDMIFKDCLIPSSIETEQQCEGVYNYYSGKNINGIHDVKRWNKLIFKNLYDSIDLILFYTEFGNLQYDFIVNPGGKPESIRIDFKGNKSIAIDESGSLNIHLKNGKIIHDQLRSFQKENISSSFILDEHTVSFKLASYNPKEKLIIDPAIRIWGTYFGDRGVDIVESIESDANDNVLISCTSTSYGSSFQAILCKFDASGKLLWQTFIGGTNPEYGSDISVDAMGNAIMVGMSSSITFDGFTLATPGAHKMQCGFDGDAFISKYDQNGKIVWFTYFGGNFGDEATNVVCDSLNNIYVLGKTKSNNGISTTNAHQTQNGTDINLGNNSDCFLTKFNSSGKQLWGTYFGGEKDEDSRGISLDRNNNVHICGHTNSEKQITLNESYQKVLTGKKDGFIAKFTTSGQYLWSTYFGGNEDDAVSDIACNGLNDIFVIGETNSTNNISTPNAEQKEKNKLYSDGFIAKFSKNGSIIWSTYIGGDLASAENSLCLSKNQKYIYACGGAIGTFNTISTIDALKSKPGGNGDNYVLIYDTLGKKRYGTYYGGESYDVGSGICVDSKNNILISGYTMSMDGISTPGAHDVSFYNTTYTDGFIGKLNLENITNVEDFEMSNSPLLIKPNPCQKGSNVHIIFDGDYDSIISYTILDVLGRIIIHKKNSNDIQQSLGHDVQTLTNGTYFINIKTYSKSYSTTISLF